MPLAKVRRKTTVSELALAPHHDCLFIDLWVMRIQIADCLIGQGSERRRKFLVSA